MNIAWHKIETKLEVIREALRTLRGYDEKCEGKEIHSLIHHELSKYNEIVRLHPELECMLTEDGTKKKYSKREKAKEESKSEEENENPVIKAYKKQFGGKKPRIDGVYGTCIIALPRIIGRDEENFPPIENMKVQEAAEAVRKFYAEYEAGKTWLRTAEECLIEILGIRKEDVLYSTLHADETTIHIHTGFFQSYILKDKDGNPRKDADGNIMYGCDRSIVSKGFLRTFHRKMADKMKDRGMLHTEALITGEGFYYDPQKMSRSQKEAAERALIEDEILQAKIDKGLITEEEAEDKFHYNEFKLKNKKRLIKEKEEEKNGLIKDIDDLKQNKQKLQSEKEKIRLDMESRLDDFQNNITEIIKNALEKFRIEALGMDENDAKTTIKVIENEIKEKIREEVVPLLEVIDEGNVIICEEEMDMDTSFL